MALSDRDRRSLIILGTVAGAVVLFFLVKMLLGGGGEEQVQGTPTAGPTGVEATAAPSPSTTASPKQTPPPIILAGQRNPFSIPPVLSPTPSGSPSGSGGPSGSPSGSPSGGGGGGGGSSTTIGGHNVSLLDIFAGGTKVQVEVDGTVYTVSEGDTFAGGEFQLVSIGGDCARFLFGDEAFSLCLNPQK